MHNKPFPLLIWLFSLVILACPQFTSQAPGTEYKKVEEKFSSSPTVSIKGMHSRYYGATGQMPAQIRLEKHAGGGFQFLDVPGPSYR